MHIFHILIYFTYKIYKMTGQPTGVMKSYKGKHTRARTHTLVKTSWKTKKNVKHINGYLPAYDTNPEDGDLSVGMSEEGSRRP